MHHAATQGDEAAIEALQQLGEEAKEKVLVGASINSSTSASAAMSLVFVAFDARMRLRKRGGVPTRAKGTAVEEGKALYSAHV